MPPKKQKTLDFEIKEFDMNSVPKDKKLLFLGKTGSGKSSLVVDYLYHNRDFPLVYVICPTELMNETYAPHVPAATTYEHYNPETIGSILKSQAKVIVTKKDKGLQFNSKCAIIMDDCLADADEWVNDKNISWIFNNGRHNEITFIIALQYPVGIPPKLRSNIQYSFLCRENQPALQRKYYELYAGVFPTFDLFQSVFLKCTEDYGCLVIKNDSLSSNLEDQVFHYKIDFRKRPFWSDFKLCYKELWIGNDMIQAKRKKSLLNDDDDYTKYKNKSVTYNVIKTKY